MYRLEFTNSKNKTIYVQVDPWACLYRLQKNDRIEFIMNCTSDEPSFSIDEYDDDNRIVTLNDCEEFFVAVDGERVHWEEYQSDIDGE